MSKRWILSVLAVTLMALQISYPMAHGTSSPTIANAVVDNFQTSLTLSSGAGAYIYNLVTGGGFPTGTFANGEYASVTNVDGYLGAALAVTTSDTNSYTTQTAYYAIGGIGVSGFSSYSSFYGSNSSAAASSASVAFSVTAPGSLVVIAGSGSSEQSISISGVPGFGVDATNFNGSCNQGLPPIIMIGHSYLSTGSYSATEQTTQCAAGQDPNHAGDLIGAFVFSPATTQTTTITSVSCSPLIVEKDNPTTCTAQVTGNSPTGVVTFSSSSNTGAFVPSNGQCNLSSGSCSVSFSDAALGSDTITSSYAGDASNEASSGMASIMFVRIYNIDLKSWIPQESLIDPFDPIQMPYNSISTIDQCFTPANPSLTTVQSVFLGDNHVSFDGNRRAEESIQFDWNGTAIVKFPQSPVTTLGTTIRVMTYRTFATRLHVGTPTTVNICQFTERAGYSCVGPLCLQQTGASSFNLNYAAVDQVAQDICNGPFPSFPWTSTVCGLVANKIPPLNATISGVISADGTLALSFKATDFPSAGFRVTGNGIVQETYLYNDASCVPLSRFAGILGLTLETATNSLTIYPSDSGLSADTLSPLC